MRETQNVFLDTCVMKTNQITVKANDCNSRFLKIQISANDEILDLTNCTVCLYSKKDEQTVVFSQANFLDAQNGIVEVELSSNFLKNSGEVLCEVKIYSLENVLLSSMPFTIRVVGSICEDNAVEASNEFSALTSAMTKVNDLVKLSNDAQEKLEDVDTSLSVVDEKLDEIDQKIEQATQIINNKLPDECVTPTTFANAKINVFDKTKLSIGFIDYDGLVSTDTDLAVYTSDYIEVAAGEKYVLSAGSSRGWACYDENKDFIAGSRKQIDTSYGGVRTIEIPQNSTYIRIQCEDNEFLGYYIKKFMVCPGTTLPDTFIPYGATVDWVNTKNKLSGKTMLVFGDSIMAADPINPYAHVYGMFEQIADENIMNLHNKAVNGATMLISSTGDNNIYSQIIDEDTPTQNIDYIFLNGGVNDIIYQSIGSITEFCDSEVAQNTFCGGFEKTLRKLITTYPQAQIYYLTTHKIPFSIYLKTYMNKAKEICDKYSVRVIDLFSYSGICTDMQETAEPLFLPNSLWQYDGIHPNTKGYEKLAKQIYTYL